MSKTRKISDCINLRISLGNYQHIEFIKYLEEQIEYSTEEERKKQEDNLHADLVDSLIRSIRETPARFNGSGHAQEVEESIKKKIPEWLEKNAVPNIANTANSGNTGPKREIQVQATQQLEADRSKAFLDVDKQEKKKVETPVAPVTSVEKTVVNTDDLFDDEPTPPKKVEVVKEEKKEVVKPAEKPAEKSVEKSSAVEDFGSFDDDDFLK